MESFVNGKNTNTVEVKGNCIACGKGECDDHITISLILPIHSDVACVTKQAYNIMQLNKCGNPNIDSLNTLLKLLSEVSSHSSPK